MKIEPGIGQRGCQGKLRYATTAAAELVIEQLLTRSRRDQGKKGATLGTYKCPTCSFFHIGHSRYGPRRATP